MIVKRSQWISLFSNLGIVLLLPVFFVLHGYNQNFGLIPAKIVLELLLKYEVLSFIIFWVCFLIFRTPTRVVLATILLLGLYFFFGAVHDFFRSVFGYNFFTSYKLFLPLLFLITGFFLIRLWKTKKKLEVTVRYWGYLIIMITLLETGNFSYQKIFIKPENSLADALQKIPHRADTCKASQKPDIFFIVLDGYTSSLCLQKEFDYSNAVLDSLLRNNQFYIAASSRSNYNVTPFSLSATLHMNYLKTGIENLTRQDKLFLQAILTLKNNPVTSYLQKEGYQLKNFGCFDFADAPSSTTPYFADLFYRQLDDQTLWSRVRRDIGWHFSTRNPFTRRFRIPQEYLKNKEAHLHRNRYNWNQLRKEITQKSDSPRFVYAHLMLPHEPFYLDKNGGLVSDTAIILNSLNLKTAYLNQVMYVNGLLKDLIPRIAVKSPRERVVVLQGDHGFRDYGNPAEKDKEFMNLHALYFSDQDYSSLYESLSPVNSFRVIFNKYFCQHLSFLKDSSIYLPK